MWFRLLLRRGGRRGLVLLGLLAAGTVTAQPAPIKFGVVPGADLTAAPFAADSAAPAVVLCDYGRSYLRGKADGLEVVFERVTRIKILKKAGYDEATVEIPLYHREGSQEKISSLRGCTYNLVNGQVEKTRLEPAGAFLEKRTASVNVQKFTLPNVRVGAVVEYAYTLTSDFLFNFQDWTFERRIPVRWSEYRTSIPVFYRYKIIYQSSRPFDVDQTTVGAVSLRVDDKLPGGAGAGAGLTVGSLLVSAPTEEHRWALKNLPAFADEPYMTTARDYVARLDFELTGEQWPNSPYHDLTGTWAKIDARLLADADFGGRLNEAAGQVTALAVQHPELADRVAAVRAAVLAAVRYDGTNRYDAPEPLRKALAARRGTAADVNLLLIAALRAAGLPAQPLLLSTRDHGRVSQEYPLLDRFNYVVALVPQPGGPDLLVDATEPLLPCGVLPERCLNGAGRLIAKKPEEGRWVELRQGQRRVHYQQVALALDARGGLTGQVREEHGGLAAHAARTELAERGEARYRADLLGRHEGWTLAAFAVADRADAAKPLALNYTFAQPADDNAPAATLYLSPLAAFGTRQNPFQHEQRTFPVDFGAPQDETMLVTLTLPAGYELAELPKPAVVDLPGGSGRFVYSATAPTPGTVQFTSRLSLREALYPAGQYANLRELYRLMLAKQSEKLVIKKKA